MRHLSVFPILAAALAAAGCNGGGDRDAAAEERWTGHVLAVTSPAFADHAPIPKQHAYEEEGENVSPLLFWSNVPQGAEQFALVCEDPDAPGGTWVHWVIYGIPKDATGLPEGVPAKKELGRPVGALQGENSWGEVGWGGPLPPKGSGPHRYRFVVYALKLKLELKPGLTAAELREAMHGHVIGRGELVGTYRRD